MKVTYRECTFFILTLISLIIGNLYSINIGFNTEIESLTWIIVQVVVVVYLFFFTGFKFKLLKKNCTFLVVWEFLILAIFYSKYSFGEFIFWEFVTYSLLVPIVFFLIDWSKYQRIFYLAFILSLIPIIIYLGPFNTLGIILSFIGVVSLSFFSNNLRSGKLIYFIYFVFLLLIYISRSRTSLISFLIIGAIVILFILMKNSNNYSGLVKSIFSFFVFTIIFLLALPKLEDLIFSKWSGTSHDFTSGRTEIWSGTLNNIKLFGNGPDYYESFYNVPNAHNTFFEILGTYGSIPLILFIILILIILKRIINIKKIEYITFFGLWFILSMSEDLFFVGSRLISIQLMFYFNIALLLNKKIIIKEHSC